MPDRWMRPGAFHLEPSMKSKIKLIAATGCIALTSSVLANDQNGALPTQDIAAEKASVQTTAGDYSPRYELSRSESLLMMNIEADEWLTSKANYMHLENVFTGQTYRVKLRSGTHLLKVEAGVYKADFDRLNSRLFAEKTLQGAGIRTPNKTELTLMPQTVNFGGTWSFSQSGDNGSLVISDKNNPSFAVAKRYPVIAQYPLHSNKGGSTRLVAKDWPAEARELVSFRN